MPLVGITLLGRIVCIINKRLWTVKPYPSPTADRSAMAGWLSQVWAMAQKSPAGCGTAAGLVGGLAPGVVTYLKGCVGPASPPLKATALGPLSFRRVTKYRPDTHLPTCWLQPTHTNRHEASPLWSRLRVCLRERETALVQ